MFEPEGRVLSTARSHPGRRADNLSPADLRSEVRAARRALAWRWGLAAAGILLLLSLFSAGFFLYAALVVGGLLAVAVAVAVVGGTGLTVERRLDRTEIELGQAVDGSVSLRNGKGVPAPWIVWRDHVEPGLDVEGEVGAFESLPARAQSLLTYRLHSTRRGLFRVGPAVIEAAGPFGLVSRFRVDADVRFVTVYPRTVALGQGWPLGHRPIHQVPRRRSLFEDPSRFFGVRPYRPGEGLRRVHWRATARSGELQVKVFEPAVLAGALLAVEMGSAAFPRAKDDPEPESGDVRIETAITAAASLAELVLAGGQEVALLSNGADAAERYPEDWSGGTFRRLDDLERAMAGGGPRRRLGPRPVEVPRGRGAWQRERLRAALARLVPAPSISLPELLTLELPRLPRSLVVMIVTPAVGPALGGAIDSLRRSGFEVGVLWIRAGEDPHAAAAPAGALPVGVPVWAVRSDADLEALGSARL